MISVIDWCKKALKRTLLFVFKFIILYTPFSYIRSLAGIVDHGIFIFKKKY